MTDHYRRVDLVGARWRRCDVAVADTFDLRRRGLTYPGVDAILLSTRSIHTFTMRAAITVALIDADGVVNAVTTVRPMRLIVRARPWWMLEWEDHDRGPVVGERLQCLPSRADGRHVDSLWNPDREPR